MKKREESLTIKIYLTMAKKENAQKTDFAVFEPYRVVLKNGKYVIVLGNAIVSEKEFTTKMDAIAYIKTKAYKLMFDSILYLTEMIFDVKRKEEVK